MGGRKPAKFGYIPWMIAGLTAYGLILRVYALGHLSLWLDEAITIHAAKMIHVSWLPVFPSGWLYTAGFVQSYILAVVGLFSWSEFWMRFPSVLVGTAVIPVSWFVARKVWNDRVGLSLAAFMTVSYWQVAWSRQARMYIFLELFVIVALYYGWRFVQDVRARDGVIAGVCTVLAVSTHTFGIILVPALAGMWLLQHRTLKLPGGFWHQAMYAMLGMIAAVLAVRALFGLEHTMWYLGTYVVWLRMEYVALLILAPIAIIIGKKERFVLGVIAAYLCVLSVFVPVFGYRYTILIIPLMAVLAIRVIDWRLTNTWLFSFAVALLILTSTTVLLPSREVYLEPLVPQPPWREVYAELPSGHHVDAHPVIAAYYGRVPDGWYANSLTGRGDPGMIDRYLGVPAMNATEVLVVDDRSLAATKSQPDTNSKVYGEQYWSRAYVTVLG